MDPKHELEQQEKRYYPFMTCIVRVNTKTQWPRTLAKILRNVQGVQNFRMTGEGLVEISGTVDPDQLLKTLGKSGKKAQLCWFQYGECSSNLFMQNYTANAPPGSYGRFLQYGHPPRPKLPSREGQKQDDNKNEVLQTHDQMQDFEQAHKHLSDNKSTPVPRTKAIWGPGGGMALPPPLIQNFEQAHKHLHHNTSTPAPRTKVASGPSRVMPRAPAPVQNSKQACTHMHDNKMQPAPRTYAALGSGQHLPRAPAISGEGTSCCSLM